VINPMHPIHDILEDLRAGKMIVLVDDESRENEGDLVCAAQFATPQVINFMLREGRGMLCVALSSGICDELELVPQATVNTSQRSTAYTITVDADARFGITTGVSAADRSTLPAPATSSRCAPARAAHSSARGRPRAASIYADWPGCAPGPPSSRS
jgi:3,4-dihydroxy 2-butanone 4-phosphate synthase/GTP cyclohydrolase II